MKTKIYNQNGEVKNEVKLDPMFCYKNDNVNLSDYIKFIHNSKRSAIADTKDRSEVRGGGKKPWKQKGTGRARHGSSRSPIWIGGGVTFGPRGIQSYSSKLNKKTRKNSISKILSHFTLNSKLVLVESLKPEEQKTKNAVKIIENLNLEGKISLIISDNEKEAKTSFRNLPYIVLMYSRKLDIQNLISSDYLLITKTAYNELINKDAKTNS